jgi:DeoR/GlpR family transcriptional regulator of sugar metabolism
MRTLRSLQIVDYLKERKYCSMNELMQQFNVSPATIHRDITALTRKKLMQKVHGGVALMPAAEAALTVDSHFSARIRKETGKKTVIAELAQSRIEDGDIVFLDSSTTALYLARRIRKLSLGNLTVITNSVHIIQEFCLFPPHFVLVGLGGNYNCPLNSLLGKRAVEGLQRLRIGKAFVSAVGAAVEGVTTYHEDHAEFLGKVLPLSTCRYLLLDSTKFDRRGLFKFADLRDFDAVFCDSKPAASLSGLIRRAVTP